MIAALNAIEVITLFVEDLVAARKFYSDVFESEVVYADDACSVMKIGTVMLNILIVTQAPMLVEPVKVATPGLGARGIFTIRVNDTNAVCKDLKRHGVARLNGPIDRPWGRRTAAFADPAGHVWEIAQDLTQA